MKSTETPIIPAAPNSHPKDHFRITKNTHAKSIIVSTSFQIRKEKEEYFNDPFSI